MAPIVGYLRLKALRAYALVKAPARTAKYFRRDVPAVPAGDIPREIALGALALHPDLRLDRDLTRTRSMSFVL
jgi:hypothetical protein